MKRFIAATGNKGKLKEIKEILAQFPLEVISMGEAGIHDEIEETGSTFEDNALLKAKYIAGITNEMVMADDSGLEVDYINGEPGIYSQRFAGPGASDADKNNKLLGLLEGVPIEKRTARFVCAIAVVFPSGKSFTVRGTCEGYISDAPAGDKGFGYDPIFNVPAYNMTIAQMESEVKNRISHRGNALRLMVQELKSKYIAEFGFTGSSE